ncbi:MAG TPA: NAD(P)/FAD-dependent oxidoreductase [Steroidobacteraceae bacterium]|nr:NAD(P)/FAD-dependent oxidoreductase [Steroidobacteraceae bacterium]
MKHFDVIVLGGGVAGLAAAYELAQRELSVCVVEAKDRFGGRVFSRRERDVPMSIELGPELIHGLAPTTRRWLKRVNIASIDAVESRWTLQQGKLKQGSALFESMKRGLDSIRPPVKDLPFADFLDRHSAKLSAPVRKFACSLVEGFDAADSTRVSTLETLKGWSGTAAADAPTFRPMGGYGKLIDGMVGLLDPKSVQLQLNTIAREIQWSDRGVKVLATQYGKSMQLNARRAIVTLPLGVLQLPVDDRRAVRFTPALSQKESAMTQLAVGSVLKVILHYRQAFWEELSDGRYRDAAFFHAPNETFRTFWTSLPIRVPVMVAWAGGPNAARLSAQPEAAIVCAATRSLDRLFATTGKRASWDDQLQAAYVHNWQTDPFACGAYSYVLADGSAARKQLAKPLRNTLYFAGEATDQEEPATVAGALRSGEEAARKIARSERR